jgi:hypothetical protein
MIYRSNQVSRAAFFIDFKNIAEPTSHKKLCSEEPQTARTPLRISLLILSRLLTVRWNDGIQVENRTWRGTQQEDPPSRQITPELRKHILEFLLTITILE